MYTRHFGLQHAPFSIAPDPRYLFMSERHREALAHLLFGLQSGGGFVLLTGEIGAGKTTVCRAFLEQVPKNNHVAYIFNPKLTAPELLQSVCDELGVPVQGAGIKAQIDALNAFLLQAHAAGENSVLVIDEAQSLAADVLEQLRLLTNLETNERKLLQIILIGQPELRDMLARPELEQLAQRVIARFHLGALDGPDTTRYMRHRLAVAGATGVMPFERSARTLVFHLTAGVPRRINLLCDRALLAAYVAGAARADKRHVRAAAKEVFDGRRESGGRLFFGPSAQWANWVAASVAMLVVGAVTWWALVNQGTRQNIVLAEQPKLPGSVASASVAVPALPTSPVARATSASAPDTQPSPALAAWAWPQEPWPDTQAWRTLATLWGVSLVDLSRCENKSTQGTRCLRTPAVNLALLRQLARPGVLTLQSSDGRKTSAVLVGLTANAAHLRLDGAPMAMSLASFGAAWLGDFGTLYRLSPQAGEGKTVSPDWLSLQLNTLPASEANAEDTTLLTLGKRVQAFQRAQGLPSDGVPGAMTLMQLNRALGVLEPRLTTVP